jgi:hypothetical protein
MNYHEGHPISHRPEHRYFKNARIRESINYKSLEFPLKDKRFRKDPLILPSNRSRFLPTTIKNSMYGLFYDSKGLSRFGAAESDIAQNLLKKIASGDYRKNVKRPRLKTNRSSRENFKTS